MHDPHSVSNEQKEACAVSAMRAMLEDYSARNDIPFARALEEFAQSPCYKMLFDYDTRLWAEGPDYLGSMLEEYADKRNHAE